jgi:hypothetical protein
MFNPPFGLVTPKGTPPLTGYWTEPTLDNSATDWLLSIAVTEKRVYIAGRFTSVNGVPRNCIAALDRATGAVLPWLPSINIDPSAFDSISNLVVVNGVVFMSVTKFSGDGTITNPITGSNQNADLLGVAEFDGSWVTPNFQFDATYWSMPATARVLYVDWNGVLAAQSPYASGTNYRTAVYVGGYFSTILGGVGAASGFNFWCDNIIEMQSTMEIVNADWNANVIPPDTSSGAVWTLLPDPTHPGQFYMGGDFASIMGFPSGIPYDVNGLCRIDAYQGTVDTTFNPAITDPIGSVPYVFTGDTDGEFMYLGGTFTKVAGVNAGYIVKLNSNGTRVALPDPGFNLAEDNVIGLKYFNGQLYLDGLVHYASTVFPKGVRFTRWDTNFNLQNAGITDDTGKPNVEVYVNSIAFTLDGYAFLAGASTDGASKLCRKFAVSTLLPVPNLPKV